jgi:rod shape-determining protein MreC
MVVYRRDTRPRSVLLAIVFVSLLLVTLDSRGNGIITGLKGTARDVIAPIQSVVDDAFSPVRNLFSGVTDYGSLKDQNTKLKQQIANLEGKLERERAVGSKVGELEKLLDLPTVEDATGVAVRVISGAPDNFERTVQVNKGTSSGVDVGQPVVAGNGLVGEITEASRTRATITLIDSPGLGVGVRLERSENRGIAEGRTGERNMRLDFLENPRIAACQKGSAPTCVRKGELVFTAATGTGVFPPDIPVASVVSVDQAKGALEPTVTLKPLVNLDDLTFLKVLRPNAG